MSLKLLLLYQVNVHQFIKPNEHILIPNSQCLAAAFVPEDVFSFLKLATPLLSVNAHSPGLPDPSNLLLYGLFTLHFLFQCWGSYVHDSSNSNNSEEVLHSH